MLSLVKQWFQTAAIDTKSVDSAWFELWLFKTQLRFQLPESTAPKHKSFNSVNCTPDARPFVNTEARQLYQRMDELGYYALPFYTAGWRKLPSEPEGPAYADLRFDLTGYAVTTPDTVKYPNVKKAEIATAWLENFYATRNRALGQHHLKKHNDDIFELVISDSNKGVVVTAANNGICETLINGHTTFKVQTEPNRISYWLPFSERDFARFDFTLQALSGITEENKAHTLKWADKLSQSIISSVNLMYPDRKALPPA